MAQTSYGNETMPRNLSIGRVRRALQAPLPGVAAQSRMATRPRSSAADFDHPGPPREGAVLVLLYPCDGRLCFPLTRRTERVLTHRGQISLPGGGREAADRTLWDTAAREAMEEIGVDPSSIEQIGALTPLYVPPSHFTIQPFVGYAPHRPTFRLSEDEVAELIEMPLEALLDPAAKAEESRLVRGRMIQAPYYRRGEHVIWGATAMILSELEVILSTLPDSSSPDPARNVFES
jgi:8-oxo-dGTP pyrophosphatase MutT (NUDIX family)